MRPNDHNEVTPSWLTFLQQNERPRERVSTLLAERAGVLLDRAEAPDAATSLRTQVADVLRRGGALVVDTVARALWDGVSASLDELQVAARNAFGRWKLEREGVLGHSRGESSVHARVDGDEKRLVELEVQTSRLDEHGDLHFRASFAKAEEAEDFIGGAVVVFFGKDPLMKRLCCLNAILASPGFPQTFEVQGKLLPTRLGARELDPRMLEVTLVPKPAKGPSRKRSVPQKEAGPNDLV